MATLAATAAGCVFGMLTVPVPSRMRLVRVDQRGEEHQARGDVLGAVGDVLADVALHEAQLVGEDERLAVLGQAHAPILAERMDRHREKSKLHVRRASLLCALRIERRAGTVPDWRGAILSHFAPDHAVIASQADAVPP